jgi:hypothetical protein
MTTTQTTPAPAVELLGMLTAGRTERAVRLRIGPCGIAAEPLTAGDPRPPFALAAPSPEVRRYLAAAVAALLALPPAAGGDPDPAAG